MGDKKIKKIFTRKVAIYLREKGFEILDTEVNFKYPKYDVYLFEETPELIDALISYEPQPYRYN